MKFFFNFIFIVQMLIIHTEYKSTYADVSQQVPTADPSADIIRALDALDEKRLAMIENKLSLKIKEIRDTLAGEDVQRRDSMITQLNKIFSTIFPSVALELANVLRFVDEVFVPNQIPNSFLCAWILIVEITTKVYKLESIEQCSMGMKAIFELADKITKKKSIPLKNDITDKKRLPKSEFIAILKYMAPNIGEDLINNVADHGAKEYFLYGKHHYYHDKVMMSYTGWIQYLETSQSALNEKINMALKLYYPNNFKRGQERFALIMARNNFIGNNIKHYFWEKYQHIMALKPIHDDKGFDFDEILDSVYREGWFYTTEDFDLFNLLVQAMKKDRIIPAEIPLQYEPFLERPTVGMPLSLACRYSKRNFNYFYRHWTTSTTSTPIRNVGT